LSSLNTLNVVPTIAAWTGGKTRQSSLESSARFSIGSALPEEMPAIQTNAPALSLAAVTGFDPHVRDAVAFESARDGASSLIVPRKEPVEPNDASVRYFTLPRSTLPAAESSILRTAGRFAVLLEGVEPRAEAESLEQAAASRVASRAATSLVEGEAVTE
jgi:hypothetical protein